MNRTTSRSVALLITLATVAGAGCTDPFYREETPALRQRIIETNRQQLRTLSGELPEHMHHEPRSFYMRDRPERIQRLDEISGPAVYAVEPIDPGEGLEGMPTPSAGLTLEQAVVTALRHNLDVEFAQLQPGLSAAEVVAAEAAFDAVFFSEANYSRLNQPQPATVIEGIPVGRPLRASEGANLTTGIRQPLSTGGQVAVQTGFDYSRNRTPGVDLEPDPAWGSDLLIGVSQPLLRNFGALVNRSEIALSRNAHRRDVLTTHAQLLNTLAEVEEAYWRLVAARYRLAIQQRLLGMTVETRGTLERRFEFDVNPVQMAQAHAFVEARRENVIRAQQEVRNASDNLKRLLNDPNLPLADEAVLIPLDEPVELPVEYNLLDAVTTALRKRPEVRQALLEIDSASIRQAIADNQRLPVLNLNAQVRINALDESLTDSYRRIGDAEFVDYLVGAQFEVPIGYRAAEADYRRARLTRQLNVVQYQRTTQQVVQGVKIALRELQTAYRLIGINRDARRAAADNLRVLLEREERDEALTPEFLLDLKLATQQRLADAETRELQAIIDYNIAIARLHQITGTLLEHNQVRMIWPDGMFSEPNGRASARRER